jgi:uncharacterized protein (DUF1330 family)
MEAQGHLYTAKQANIVSCIVERFDGKYIVRSEQVTHVSGEWFTDRIIVIEFPTRARVDACFGSEEYRSIKALRESSVVAEAVIVDQA